MLSQRDKFTVISTLDEVLGVGSSLKGNEQAHLCPFCHHHKKKLQVNLETQKWHCWVCDAKGSRISSLLRKLNVDVKKLKRIKEIYDDEYSTPYVETEEVVQLFLPQQYRPLWETPRGVNPHYRNALSYMRQRGFTQDLLMRYQVGYCEDGLYGGRVIIPSYDENYKLNYFIARSFYDGEKMKYKNPPVSKNVIIFENQINWKEPITLVEGIFDAMTIRRNSIPLLGKFVPKKLMNKIFKEGVKKINILLDDDAQEQAIYYTNYFQKQGIQTTNILPQLKDANEMGFETVNHLIKTTKETTFEDLVFQKLDTL
jgi:DNA primase